MKARQVAKGIRGIGAVCTFIVGAQALDRLFPHCPPSSWDWGCVLAGALALVVLFLALAVTWVPEADD